MERLTKFFVTEGNMKYFRFGRTDPEAAIACAAACGCFAWDDDEECVDDSTLFCYNYRYRRWSQSSFYCMGNPGNA